MGLPNPLPEIRKLPKVVVLEDSYEWTLVEKQWRNLEPFEGKVVAIRRNELGIARSDVKIGHAMYPNSSALYAKIETNYLHREVVHNPMDNTRCVAADVLSAVRLITLSEACDWVKTMHDNGNLPGDITLSNLMPSEQRKYFRNQARKKLWPTYRLLFIGSRDAESALHVLPKDIVRLLAYQVFQAEVDELQQRSKPSLVLNLNSTVIFERRKSV